MTQNKRGTATISFFYDAAGNRSQRTDYNGAITNYSYDALNRLTTISYPDATAATYAYDVLSRLTTATNAAGTVTIAYDNRARASSVTDVFGQVVSYSYDGNSNRTQLNLNGSLNATYQYDVINRLTQVTDNASLNTTFVYDATNKLTSRTLPNGVVSTFQYDGLDRLTRLTHAKGANTLADFQYQFNSLNNIMQMIDNDGTHNYSYDTLDRLTAATHPNQPNESYTYDDVGNRTASHQGNSYSYQSFNRLVSANGTTFGYDTNGNQISKSDVNGSWTYTWDFENRLKQASLSGGVAVNYSYDALGRLIQRSSSTGATTKFVYDGADVLRDLDSTGNTVADYLNFLGIDNKSRQAVAGTVNYFLTDHLGTTRSLADPSGNASGNLSFDSFGNATNVSNATRYDFTGRERDPEINLMYYRARWYDPAQGKFNSEDPIGFAGGINWYSYVANNPENYRDPLGLKIYVCSRLTYAPEKWFGANHSYLYDDRTEQTCGLSGPRFSWSPFFGSSAQEKGPNEGATCRVVDGTDDPHKADTIMNCCRNYGAKTYIPLYDDCHNLTHSCINAAGLKDPGAPGGRFGERCVKCGSTAPVPRPQPGSPSSPKCWGGGARGC